MSGSTLFRQTNYVLVESRESLPFTWLFLPYCHVHACKVNFINVNVNVNVNVFFFQVIIPPKTVPQPMRITCRYVKKDALLYPPPLNEGEGKIKKRYLIAI